MEIKDALTITVLGIGVVFGGLLLTSLMIYSFAVVSRWRELIHMFKRAPGSGKKIQHSEAAGAEPAPPVEPDIVAVITTVLEVEWRLRVSLLE